VLEVHVLYKVRRKFVPVGRLHFLKIVTSALTMEETFSSESIDLPTLHIALQATKTHIEIFTAVGPSNLVYNVCSSLKVGD
jgi:hypothetical protein